MIYFILRRLAMMIPTLTVVSILTFVIIQLPPGDYLTTYLANLTLTGETAGLEKVAALRKQYGLDLPIPVQYFVWMKGLLTGDLGTSFIHQRPVSELIWQRLGLTTMIALLGLIAAWIIALPIGIYSGVKQYGLIDYSATCVGL